MKILRPRDYYFPEIVASSHLSDDMDEAYMRHKITCINYTPMTTRGISAQTRKKYKKIKYEERNEGYVLVKRFSMIREGRNPIQRAFRYFLCSVIQYFEACKEKEIDVIYGGSTPPTQGLLCALIKKRMQKKRKVSFVYNLQDVFPDSLVNAGMTKEGSVIWKIGRGIENYTYRYADKIVVISEDIKKNIIKKGVEESKIVLISNWIDTDKVKPVPKGDNQLYSEYDVNPDKFTVVYAGNMGAAQGTDIIIPVAQRLPNVQFVIFGGGAEYSNFKEKIKNSNLNNVIVNPLLPADRVPEVYCIGDVALITCKPGTGMAGMPSKTWTIMSCNTPIIASFDVDSELSKILTKSKTGVCIPPGDVDKLVEILGKLSTNVQKLQEFDKGRKYVVENASKYACTEKTIATLKEAYFGVKNR